MNINVEKLNEYLKLGEILEFDSDEECMEQSTVYVDLLRGDTMVYIVLGIIFFTIGKMLEQEE